MNAARTFRNVPALRESALAENEKPPYAADGNRRPTPAAWERLSQLNPARRGRIASAHGSRRRARLRLLLYVLNEAPQVRGGFRHAVLFLA
jgi:hypothetical protein